MKISTISAMCSCTFLALATVGNPANADSDSSYPTEAILRPLTLPANAWQVGLATATLEVPVLDEYLTVLALRAGYGITADLEAVVGHTFVLFAPESFDDFDIGEGTIGFGLGYAVIRGAADGKLDAAARAVSGISLAEDADNPVPLSAGIEFRYRVSDTFAVVVPPDQISIALAGDPKPIAVELPIGVAVQASPNLYALLTTELATLAVNDDAGDTEIIFSDSTPLSATVHYSPNNAIDVGAGFGMDLTPPEAIDVGDTLVFGVLAAYRGGL